MKSKLLLLNFSCNNILNILDIVDKQSYTYNEAFEKSLKYFNGDELAARVWVNKYAVKDSYGNIFESSPEDMHWRTLKDVAI